MPHPADPYVIDSFLGTFVELPIALAWRVQDNGRQLERDRPQVPRFRVEATLHAEQLRDVPGGEDHGEFSRLCALTAPSTNGPISDEALFHPMDG